MFSVVLQLVVSFVQGFTLDPSSGDYGCGVAMAGDWPTCSIPFDEQYAFDFPAVMRSAEARAGRNVWRYDWRSTQHPSWGNWTYMAMDWCQKGGKDEHPDPWGPWPGLMGWNEPNAQAQCNSPFYDVTEFVKLAKQYKALGKFVVSPAPTHDAHWWLDGFLGTMHDRTDPDEHFLGIDYLAYHHYVECHKQSSSDDIMSQMESVFMNFKSVMDKWNGLGFSIKGLWLTEVSCGWVNGSWTGSCGESCVRMTMEQLIRLVQTHSELKTWSWFGYDNFGNLWVNDASQGYPLTELGQQYFGNCDPRSAANATTVLFHV